MLVYGERTLTLEPRLILAGASDQLNAIDAMSPGLPRHAALAEIFLELGALVQGLADEEFARLGQDEDTPRQRVAMEALLSLAEPLANSWASGFGLLPRIDRRRMDTLAATSLPDAVQAKGPEGYAYYAVYPEAYAEAATEIGGPAGVIGLRSIGVSLAAMAATRLGDASPVTLRPVGHPFERELRLSPRLQARLLAKADVFVVADEGPGLSGSSFAAVGRWLGERGVACERQWMMPSHKGAPGAVADPERQARWRRARKAVRDLDDLALRPRRPEHALARWVEDLTGRATGPLQDVSAGAWRGLQTPDRAQWPPADAAQERRKFLLSSDQGHFLLKFIGLGRRGRKTFEQARALGGAGFSPVPLGLRHGFIVEPWIEGLQPSGPPPLSEMARYLAFRARSFPASAHEGASPAELREMVAVNVGEGLHSEAGRRLAARIALDLPIRRIRTDGRMHPWEWLCAPDGRLLKTDAVDHADAHDLIGCQDLAWDVAGAEVEWRLDQGQTEALLRGLGEAGASVRRETFAAMRIAYPAFQLGLWTFAHQRAGADEQARIAPLLAGYRRRLQALAGAYAEVRA